MSARSDDGAVHMIEAALATVMVMATLFYASSIQLPHDDSADGLGPASSDLLNVIEYRANSLEHPSLGFTLSSTSQWKESSDELDGDIKNILPPGTYYYMETPYGTCGQRPAAGADIYIRPFIAYGSGKMLDCKLILWRA